MLIQTEPVPIPAGLKFKPDSQTQNLDLLLQDGFIVSANSGLELFGDGDRLKQPQPNQFERETTAIEGYAIDTRLNANLVIRHHKRYFPEARKVFVFATGSLRKGLFLYWQLLTQELGISLTAALSFVPPAVKSHAPKFSPIKARYATVELGPLGLQRYLEAMINNGDGQVRRPVFLGVVNGCPVYMMPTDGETASNESAIEQATNKARAAQGALVDQLHDLGDPGDRLVVLAGDVVSQVALGHQHRPPTGKPANEKKKQEKNWEEKPKLDNLLETRLFQIWYIFWYYLQDERSWPKFLSDYAGSADKVSGLQRVLTDELNELKNRLGQQAQLIMKHFHGLVVISGNAHWAVEFQLWLTLALDQFIQGVEAGIFSLFADQSLTSQLDSPSLIAYLESGAGGLFQQLVMQNLGKIEGEVVNHDNSAGSVYDNTNQISNISSQDKLPWISGNLFAPFWRDIDQKSALTLSRLEPSNLLALFHIMGVPQAIMAVLKQLSPEF